MTIGFLLLDGITNVIPDKNLTRRTRPRVLIARFGDGYEQRMKDGINNLDITYDVAFVNRTPEEADSIMEFLDERGGALSFDFTIPDTKSDISETTVKVVCENHDLIYTNSIASGVTASLRRIYE